MLSAIYRAIRHEFGLKVISVVAAASLWVYVMNHEDPMRHETYDRRVEVIGVPSGLVLSRVLPERVRITVSGRLSALQRGAMDGLRVVADASRGSEGRVQAELEVVGVPERVKVQGLERSTAQVFLDRESTMTKRVRPVVRGEPEAAKKLAERIEVRPAQVMVSGPAQSLQRVEAVVTRVDQNALTPGSAVSRPLEALDGDGQVIRGLVFRPAMVVLELSDDQTITRDVPVEPDLGSPGAGLSVLGRKVNPSHLTVRGKADALRDLKAVHTERQDISSLKGSRTWSARLAVPSGVTIPDGTESVTLEVSVGARSGASSPGAGTSPRTDEPSGGQPAAEDEPAAGGEPRPTKPTEGSVEKPATQEGTPPSMGPAPPTGGHGATGSSRPQPSPRPVGEAPGGNRR
jgi:YbbR domain-containing protein